MLVYEKTSSKKIAMNIIDDKFPMLKSLHADGAAANQAEQMMLYGQFVGSWDGKILSQSFRVDASGEVIFDFDSARHETTLEVHFGWVLQGRAIQDVWIAPSPYAEKNITGYLMYGTTLRMYDLQKDCWYITFIDPVTMQSYRRLIGRKVDADIIQEYHTKEGKLCQWNFTGITANSFHWIWRESADNGRTWKEPAEFFVKRRKIAMTCAGGNQ